MSVATVKKCAKRSCRNGILWRTYFKSANDNYRLVSERMLIDDPKNGIRDLTNYKRKYAAFDGKYVSRKSRPDNYEPPPPPLTPAEFIAQARAKFPELTEEQVKAADKAFEALRDKMVVPFIASRICEGLLSADFKTEALDAAQDAVRRAYTSYDPTHPPKPREGVNPADIPSASLETFLSTCIRNAVIDFCKWSNGDKVGGWVIKDRISNATDAKSAPQGEISAEMLPAEAKYSIAMLDLCLDCASMRRQILRYFGKKILDVFDKRLQEISDRKIYTDLKVTHRVFRTEYLRPIQRLVAMYWLEPHIPEREWK